MTVVHEWAHVRPGLEMSRDAVIVDGVRQTFTPTQARELAAKLGGRLPTPEELDARYAAAMLHNDPQPGPIVSTTALQHSAAVERSIPADYSGIVGNVGKHWVSGVVLPSGARPLYGWHVTTTGASWRGIPVWPSVSLPGVKVIQRPWDSSHNDSHKDYSMTLVIARDIGGAVDTVPPAGPASTREEIQAWQHRLNGLGLGPLVEDGRWGPRTQGATDRWRDALLPTESPFDLDAIPFVQAKHTGGRRRESILGVCIHVSQNTEHPSGAEYLQADAKRGVKHVSWHYSVDNNSVCQSVLDSDISFSAGPGNDRWLHIEFIGRVDQGRAGWADAFSTAQLALAARLTAALLRKHECPAERVYAEGLLMSDHKGVCGHSDFSAACVMARSRNLRIAPWWDPTRIARGYPDNWRKTNHGDPGVTFPWDAFMAAVRAA